jgi:acyl carrier protein
MTDDIVSTLAQKIAVEILKQPKRTIRPDDALISSGLIDSFSLVDLSILVENLYGVHLDDFELNADTFDTLEALAALIRSRM